MMHCNILTLKFGECNITESCQLCFQHGKISYSGIPTLKINWQCSLQNIISTAVFYALEYGCEVPKLASSYVYVTFYIGNYDILISLRDASVKEILNDTQTFSCERFSMFFPFSVYMSGTNRQ